jgi:hypothetical protein
MKKIFSLAMMLVSVLALFTACDEDRDSNPVITSPTTFTINQSPVADQYIQLAKGNNVNLTWSQPDYGYNAFATYKIQVGLVGDDGKVTWNEKDGKPKFLASTYTKANSNIDGEEIAAAICELDGFKDKTEYVDKGYRQVALRVYSCIETSMGEEIAGTGIMSSNYATFKHMAAYNAVKSPGFIYIVGSLDDWKEPNAGNAEYYKDWRLFENADAIDSKEYHGTFEAPAGDLMFRFYAALTGWDADSYGSQKDDNAVSCTFTNGVFDGSLVKGKGSYEFKDFPGGKVQITVNMKKNTVKVEVVK